MNKQKEFFEYIKIFFVTLSFVFITVIFFVGGIQYKIYNNQLIKPQDEEIDYSLINLLIDKNKYLEEKHPDNYTINLKLGLLYKIKNDFEGSEAEFKKSILKAPFTDFRPHYELAVLYLKSDRLADAQNTMDKLYEKPNKRLIKYKGDIYKKLGDKYYSLGDYLNAIEKYQKSLSYWQIIKDKKEIQDTNNSLASAYTYLAEIYLNNMMPDDAVNCLQKAFAIVKAPIIKYKLALLLTGSNPELAYKYFEEVFKKTPEIINYDKYNQFLYNLSEKALQQGNIAKFNLYQYKIKKIKTFFFENILSINDIALEDVYIKIKSNFFKKKKIHFECKLKNTSKYEINSLYIEIIFKQNNQIIESYKKKIVDKDSALAPGSYTPVIHIQLKYPKNNTNSGSQKITAEIYAAKTDKSYKLFLKAIEVKEPVKTKYKQNKIFRNFIKKISSKIHTFLF